MENMISTFQHSHIESAVNIREKNSEVGGIKHFVKHLSFWAIKLYFSATSAAVGDSMGVNKSINLNMTLKWDFKERCCLPLSA